MSPEFSTTADEPPQQDPVAHADEDGNRGEHEVGGPETGAGAVGEVHDHDDDPEQSADADEAQR
jgi:hypothetical protein